jgi:sulfoxide reductase heme-binding subunit YedZ
MSALLHGSSLWYASRGTGLVAFLGLSASTTLGILTRGRPIPFSLPRFAIADIHRNLSLLFVTFLAIHVASAIIDPYVVLNLVDVIVPFGGTYHPMLVGLGALGVDLMLAVLVTSALRRRLSWRAWRTVHLLAYGTWVLAFAHAILMGPDTGHGFGLGVVMLGAGMVASALASRGLPKALDLTRRPAERRPTVAPNPADASTKERVLTGAVQ